MPETFTAFEVDVLKALLYFESLKVLGVLDVLEALDVLDDLDSIKKRVDEVVKYV